MNKHLQAIWTVTILRIAGYVYMLYSPFYGFLYSLFLDWIDWYILIWFGVKKEFYHTLDKPLDYLLYVFFIPILINSPIFPLYIGAMIYRAVGYLFYYATKNRKFFVLFADIPQVIIMLHFLKLYLIPDLNIFDIRLLMLVIPLKMFEELFHHVFPQGMTYIPIVRLKNYLTNKRNG